jgi:hypothetical protein
MEESFLVSRAVPDDLPLAQVRSDALSFQPQGTPAPLNVTPLYRLFSSGQVAAATFLGGPLGATWLVAQNYSRLGSRRAAWLTVATGVVVTALLCFLGLVAGSSTPVPTLGIATLVGSWFLARAMQGDAYDRHIAAGGPRASGWVTVGLGLASLAITFGALVGGAVAYYAAKQPDSVAFGGSSVMYMDGGTEAEARAVGDTLVAIGWFGKEDATAVVRREHDRHIVELVAQDFVFTDRAMQTALHANVERFAKTAFHGEPTDVWLVDGNLDRHVMLAWEARPLQVDFGDGHVVRYTHGGIEAEARAVGKLMQDNHLFEPGTPFEVSVVRDGGVHIVELVLARGCEASDVQEGFHMFSNNLSDVAFAREPVEVRLLDTSSKVCATLAWEHRPRMLDLGHAHHIWYFDGVSEAEANGVAALLMDHGYFKDDLPAGVGVRRHGDRRNLELLMSADAFAPEARKQLFRGFAAELSKEVFGGAPVDVTLEDREQNVHVDLRWGDRPR